MTKLPHFYTSLITAVLLVMFSSASMADKWAHVPTIENATTPEEKGLAIAVAMDRKDTGWGDSEAEMEMVLRRANGQETIRRLRFKLLEVLGDGDKGLTIFDQPRDVQGTTFLNHSNALEPDDQWIYLPKLRRVKRISSKNKTGRFMGSEFTYEDMSSSEVEKYNYKYLRDESLNGTDMYVVELYPKDEFSGYKRQILWVDKAELRNYKIEFYDRRDGLLKVMEMHDYRQYMNKFWRSHKLVMTNQQTGKSTDLVWKDYKFSVGLSDADFHHSVLARVR